MKKWHKYAFIPVLAILVAAAIVLGSYTVFADRNLAFEPIAEKAVDVSSISDGVKWFAISDDNFQKLEFGSADEQYIKNEFGSDMFNTKNYTYIVTIGHTLDKISYNFTRCMLRNFVFPTEYIGRAMLDKQETGLVHIYRVRKINIDRDYHGGNDYKLI